MTTKSYIEFPRLGLHFNIDPVAFCIGGKNIYWYGIIIAIGFAVAVVAAVYLAKKNNLSPDLIYDMVIFGTPSAIVCARLYYVAFEWKDYVSDPAEIIKIWHGGIAIYGAIIGAVVSTFVYCRVKKLNLPLVFDIGGVGLVIGQIFGRWGNFVNQEAFGTNTTSVFGMTGNVIKSTLTQMAAGGINVDPSVPVHPTFFYESCWNVLVLAVMAAVFRKKKFDGQVFLTYIVLYGLGRFFIEGLRTDSLYIGQIRISQLVAAVTFFVAAAVLVYKLKKEAA